MILKSTQFANPIAIRSENFLISVFRKKPFQRNRFIVKRNSDSEE